MNCWTSQILKQHQTKSAYIYWHWLKMLQKSSPCLNIRTIYCLQKAPLGAPLSQKRCGDLGHNVHLHVAIAWKWSSCSGCRLPKLELPMPLSNVPASTATDAFTLDTWLLSVIYYFCSILFSIIYSNSLYSELIPWLLICT